MQLVVRGGDQAGVVGFGHRAALALAPAVDADPVEQVAPARRAGRHTSPATETRPRALAAAPSPPGCAPRRAQVRAFGGRRFCPASSSKQIHAPVAAASLVSSPTSRPATRRSASSSRSAARCTGTCGVNPIRCSRYDVPAQRVAGRGTAGRSASATRASVHRWSSPHPDAAGPASSAARSRASCALISRHTAPPAPLDASAASPAGPPAPPPPVRRLGADPQPPGYLRRVTSCSNLSAACSRSFSRRARPSADKPPPSGYLISPA